MSARPAARPLVGRARERAVLDALLTDVRAGRSAVLTLRGRSGVGTSALLRYVGERATGCTVVRATTAPSETELDHAGLHQLCAPLLGRLDALPRAQQEALRVAFGLAGGAPPDRSLVGLAVLALVAAAARERPLVCLVDDAHWLDRASREALGLVAARLGPAPVAIVTATHDGSAGPLARGLPELVVDALPDDEAASLLRSVVAGPVDARVLRRLLAEAHGNPLALLEASGSLRPERLAGGFVVPVPRTSGGRVDPGYADRVAALPPAARRLLLVLAAEPRLDPKLVRRAAARLGLTPDDASPAVADGLVRLDGGIRFGHPLVRPAVYEAASAQARRTAHRALAEATYPGPDPDFRAWHRAHAASGLDEAVARELDRCTRRAQERGGFAAAAAFWERAAMLSPDPTSRAERTLWAARATFRSGAVERALRLLPVAAAGAREALPAARARLLRAQVATAAGQGRVAPLLDLGRRLDALDGELAQEAYRDAFYAVLRNGPVDGDDGVLGVADAVRASVARTTAARADRSATELLLEGLTAVLLDGPAAGGPRLRCALGALLADESPTDATLCWLPLAARAAHDVWDDRAWEVLTERACTIMRRRGELRMLPVALESSVVLHLFAGRLSRAAALADEHATVARATRDRPQPCVGTVVAAWRGHEPPEDVAGADAGTSDGQRDTASAWGRAVLLNGRGRYGEALEAADRASSCTEGLGFATWSLVELVEAAARSGVPERAADAARRVADVAGAGATDWALGTTARCQALLTRGAGADALYREAIEHLSRTRLRWVVARTHLVYGEWLRRANRRVDARAELGVAHRMLAEMGSQAFAERARHELAATGATARRRSVEAVVLLTEREEHVARLAVEGRTNPEIADQLFIGARTVESHLRQVYSKLGIASREEIGDALVRRAETPTGDRDRPPR